MPHVTTKLVIEKFQFKRDLSEINHNMNNPHWTNKVGFFFPFTKRSVLYVSASYLTENQYSLEVEHNSSEDRLLGCNPRLLGKLLPLSKHPFP